MKLGTMQIDVTKNLNKTDRLLLGFVKNNINDNPERIKLLFKDTDWDDLLLQLKKHSVIPYAYHSLKSTSTNTVPKKYWEVFKSSFTKKNSVNQKALDEFTKILQIFEKAGIKNIILKGPYLSEQVYPKPDLRTFRDIDILVRKKDVGRCKDIFLRLGYEQVGHKGRLSEKEGRTQYHYLKRNVLVVDLHWQPLNNKWYPKVSTFFKENVWKESHKVRFQDTATWTLSSEVLLIYHCIHLSIHHKFEKLIWFKDIDEIVKARSIDWSAFIKKIKQYNLATYCYYALLFTKQLFSSPIPEDALKQMRPNFLTSRIFEYLLRRENFFRLHEKKRRLAIQVWRIQRDGFVERLKAIYWLLFPSIEWFLQYYPFLPRINRTFYYPFYPLLVILRMTRKPIG